VSCFLFPMTIVNLPIPSSRQRSVVHFKTMAGLGKSLHSILALGRLVAFMLAEVHAHHVTRPLKTPPPQLQGLIRGPAPTAAVAMVPDLFRRANTDICAYYNGNICILPSPFNGHDTDLTSPSQTRNL